METENKEKKKGMSKKAKNMLYSIIALVIIIGVGVWGVMYWQDNTYFTTQNAKVTAKTYTITPSVPGKLVRYNLKEGDVVKKDEVIGRIDTGAYLKSPVDGTVIKSNVTEDQLVAQTTVVAVVADTADVYIGANIEETDIIKIQKGQTVFVNLDAYPNKKFEAVVSEIESATQNSLTGGNQGISTSGTFTKVTQVIPVKIRLIDNTDLSKILGTNATIKIKLR